MCSPALTSPTCGAWCAGRLHGATDTASVANLEGVLRAVVNDADAVLALAFATEEPNRMRMTIALDMLAASCKKALALLSERDMEKGGAAEPICSVCGREEFSWHHNPENRAGRPTVIHTFAPAPTERDMEKGGGG